MVPVIEAVPNVSEGRDPGVVKELVGVLESRGADVLDWTSDPDHHRSVITFVGDPATVEEASVEMAGAAAEAIDLRTHDGIHPRIGALDVLPFVPLMGVDMEGAVELARRVARRLADEAGVPAYLYGRASNPPGRLLADLRRGGFEALVTAFPDGRTPDALPESWSHPGIHPTAGATCVGARPILLAWNVDVAGLGIETVRRIAADARESGGGFPGLRALGLELSRQERIQISMNLEDPEGVSPFRVFLHLEREVEAAGGRIAGTEIIGLVPDTLVFPAAGNRLQLLNSDPSRLLSRRLARHLGERAEREARSLRDRVRNAGEAVPSEIRDAVERFAASLSTEQSKT